LRACTSFVAEGMHILTGADKMEDRPPIVGGRPRRAAETLAAAGLAPIVLDEAPASGGQIYRRAPAGFTRPIGRCTVSTRRRRVACTWRSTA
jgi:hypothetical protein